MSFFPTSGPYRLLRLPYLETAAEGQITDSPFVIAGVALSFDTLRTEAFADHLKSGG
jgi:hypothetical protein